MGSPLLYYVELRTLVTNIGPLGLGACLGEVALAHRSSFLY
jgi:hypothetical protein